MSRFARVSARLARKVRKRGQADKGSKRFLGLIVKEADRQPWQIIDDLTEFYSRRPRPWRHPGAVSRVNRRLYAYKRSRERELQTALKLEHARALSSDPAENT